MSRDLETLKSALWDNFEKAVARQKKYEETDSDRAIAARAAMAKLATAIIQTETEQRLQAQNIPSLLSKKSA